MKIELLGFVLFVLIVNAISSPVEEVQAEEHSRVKRFSCDVLGSIEAGPVKLNDAACAARCLLQRHKGGYCDNKKQCHCR
ncbi:unnamed protein product [Psylliodes chrysocephalus]|uniref:Invertebrate defensins family profile domain-containing protein n=1 Tax=Psylliodes chrysocephalus TaxID=3402493 RepID=A0A9P0GAI1_9CUCU|nr:unnamed protein product [Psylliodes chrysocephala]